MIFTDRFVYVHMPKTGGTFVTKALKTVYQEKVSRTALPDPHFRPAPAADFQQGRELSGRQTMTATKTVTTRERPPNYLEYLRPGPLETRWHDRYGEALFWAGSKHGPCWQIPTWERGKPVLATIRNPYDWYVSQYEYGWWKQEHFVPCFRSVPRFAELYPRFPDISFAEYVELVNSPFCWYASRPAAKGEGLPNPREDLGMYTLEFLNFYFRKPETIYPIMDDDYISSGRYKQNLFPVRFIHTKRISKELYEFLVEMGFKQEDVSFVNELGVIRPEVGKLPSRLGLNCYTPELKSSIRQKERLLFALFPEFDV